MTDDGADRQRGRRLLVQGAIGFLALAVIFAVVAAQGSAIAPMEWLLGLAFLGFAIRCIYVRRMHRDRRLS